MITLITKHRMQALTGAAALTLTLLLPACGGGGGGGSGGNPADSSKLYVVDSASNAILVFNDASTVNGNVAPSRTLSGPATTLVNPFSIWLQK